MDESNIEMDLRSLRNADAMPITIQMGHLPRRATPSPEIFPFLLLPREIRDMIYDLCADWNDSIRAFNRVRVWVNEEFERRWEEGMRKDDEFSREWYERHGEPEQYDVEPEEYDGGHEELERKRQEHQEKYYRDLMEFRSKRDNEDAAKGIPESATLVKEDIKADSRIPTRPHLSTPTTLLLNRQIFEEAKNILGKKPLRLEVERDEDYPGCCFSTTEFPDQHYHLTDYITYRTATSIQDIEIRCPSQDPIDESAIRIPSWIPWLSNLLVTMESCGAISMESKIHMIIGGAVEETSVVDHKRLDCACECTQKQAPCTLHDPFYHCPFLNPMWGLVALSKFRRVTLSTPLFSRTFGYGISYSPHFYQCAMEWMKDKVSKRKTPGKTR